MAPSSTELPAPTPRRRAGGIQGASTPEQIAERMQAFRNGTKRWRDKGRDKAWADEVAACTDLAQIRAKVSRRHFEIAMWHLGGYDNETIRQVIGYSDRCLIMRILRRPEVAKMIDLVRAAQLERVIKGEFGVRAQAKAAAPTIMKRVIEKAGGREDGAGNAVGMARKDADALRAADLALTISGDKVEQHAHVHAHTLLQGMSPQELRAYAESGVLPERLAHIGQTLAARRVQAAVDVTPED